MAEPASEKYVALVGMVALLTAGILLLAWVVGGEMFRQVDGIAVAGELREAHHIGRRHDLLEPLGHADREILEEKRP
jgi:hypothetical protein